MKKFKYLYGTSTFIMLICVLLAFSAQAYVVTELQATYSNGQTFLTWQNPAATNLQYKVYRSSSPLSNAATLDASTFLGYVRDNSAKNIRKTTLQGQNFYFIINPSNGPLASDRGLYVATCTNNAPYYYAVTVVNLSTNIEDKSVLNSGNRLSTPISEAVADPQPVLQYETVETDGTLRHEYVQWGNNQNTSHYPAFNNAGSYGYNFTLFEEGNTTNGGIYLPYIDDDPFSTSGINSFLNCYILKIDDWLPNGVATDWTGWNENYNMYSTTNPVALTGVVRMYTQTRIKETVEWVSRNTNADSNKVYVTGISHNGFGAILTAQMYPEMIAAAYVKITPIVMKAPANSEREQQWCKTNLNLPTDYLDPNTGLAIPVWKLFDIRHMLIVNSKRGLPFIGGVHGKQDVTIGWVQGKFWYDSVSVSRIGGTWFWDQRIHDNSGAKFLDSEVVTNYERFTLTRSFPSFSYCSINQNPGNGLPGNGDPWGAFNGYLDWSDASIADNPLNYSITCFVKNLYAGGIIAPSQYDSCTADLTFRRIQKFHPTIGQTVYWNVKKTGGITVQSGSFTYSGNPITLNGIKIYRNNSYITMTVQDCSILYYPDLDHDGFGSATASGTAYCDPPAGVVTNHTDCNDANAAIRPTAQEICDANDVDEDCDGLSDDADPSAAGKILYYIDSDNDGYGAFGSAGTAYCNPPSGVAPNNTDCNDANTNISPAAIDICDGIDNNCNGVTDENAITVSISPSGATSGCNGDLTTLIATGTNIATYQWFKDNNAVSGETNSTYSIGYDNTNVKLFVSNSTGCSNMSNEISLTSIPKPVASITVLNSGNLDLCLGNVILTALEVPNVSWQWYREGIVLPGDTNLTHTVSNNGNYTVKVTNTNTGCFKTSLPVSVNGPSMCFIDADNDGYGSSSDPGVSLCNVPLGLVTNNGDCNDLNPSVNPAANELCDVNGIDEDCDGLADNADPSAIGKINYYVDADNDGYGSSSDPGTAYCHPPAGVQLNQSDCNDANATIHPFGTELCDANDIDEDCDGLSDDADPSATGKILYYVDSDNDGYGSPSDPGILYCNPPAGRVNNKVDCNESNASIHPNANELCDANNVDEDCDGLSDDSDPSTTGKTMYYIDADADGFGSSSDPGTAYCHPPSGLVTNNSDCMDGNANVHPGVTEICDGLDNNCNGAVDENTNPSNPLPHPVITATGATSFCYDQSVTLSAQAGFNQYTWSNGKSGQSITADANGLVTVTVKDGNNCYGTSPPVNLTVWEPLDPSVSCVGPTTYCEENPSTLVTVPGYAYQWKKGATVLTGATNQSYQATSTSTSYKVTITDNHGCSKTSDNFALVVNAASTPTLTVTGGTSICQGQSSTITATSGFNSYLWSSGQTNPSISVSTSGNYFVTATDANGCSAASAIKTIVVNSLPNPVITPLGATSFCDGGSVTLDAGSGYNGYNWSNGKVTQTVSILTSGSYSVTVTNANGCSATASPVSVTAWTPPTPVVSTSSGTTTFCANAGIYLTTIAGYNYQWQKSNVNIQGATSQNYTPTSGGSYKVIITDIHGCSKASVALSITINNSPAPVITGSGTVCQGSTVTLSCGTFSAYTWSTGSHASSINVNSSGSYTVTVTDANGCTATSPVKTTTLVPLPAPVITAQGPVQFCDGGTVTLDAGSGYSSYNWSNAKTTQTVSITASGTFTVTVTNSSGCSGTSGPLTVNEWIPPTPTVSTSTGATVFCSNAGVYLTTIPGYTYQWQKSGVNIAGAIVQNYTPTSSGSYKVIITDSHGCSKTSAALSITINNSPAPVITGSATVCQGSSVTLSCGTFSAYTWSTGSHASSISTNTSGNYTVTVTDANGCSGTSPVKTTTLVQLPVPVITAQGPTQFCDGGTVTLDAGSGYSSYSWSNAKTTQTVAITASGTFTATVTNASGCSATSPAVTVTEWILPNPVVTLVGPATYCSGAGTYLTTIPGYSYQWLKGTANQAGATDQTYAPIASSTYKVKITDTHGCTKTTTTGVAVTVNPLPTASISVTTTTNLCGGATVKLTEATQTGNLYQWRKNSANISGATASTYTAAVAGDYTCKVTKTTGCTAISNTITVTSNCKDEEAGKPIAEGVSWLIYPNPTSNELHIRMNMGDTEDGSYQVEIKNVVGGTVWRNESLFTDHTISEDLYMDGALASGVYFIIVHVHEHVYRSQFILSRK